MQVCFELKQHIVDSSVPCCAPVKISCGSCQISISGLHSFHSYMQCHFVDIFVGMQIYQYMYWDITIPEVKF